MNMGFATWVTILIVAVVLGLLNALIVPIVKGIFKKANATILLIISLIIDAAALWLAGMFVPGFFIEFFPTAIIAAAILALLNVGFSSRK